MAKAIAVVPVPSENQQGAKDELLRRLDAAPLEHAAALLALWDLLEAAHEKQLIETARGAIAASDTIINRLAEAAANPGAVRGLRNMFLLAELLGALDPEILHGVVQALPGAVDEHRQAVAAKAPSLWAILRQMSSPDARRVLGLLAGVMTTAGAALSGKNRPDGPAPRS